MKKLTALLLALILACTLPLLFAFDAAQPHDHDCEHDHEDGLMRVRDPWCDVCNNYTSQTTNLVDSGCDYYDANSHLYWFQYEDVCNTCGSVLNSHSTDSLSGHSFDSSYIDGEGNFHRRCEACGYVEPFPTLATPNPVE